MPGKNKRKRKRNGNKEEEKNESVENPPPAKRVKINEEGEGPSNPNPQKPEKPKKPKKTRKKAPRTPKIPKTPKTPKTPETPKGSSKSSKDQRTPRKTPKNPKNCKENERTPRKTPNRPPNKNKRTPKTPEGSKSTPFKRGKKNEEDTPRKVGPKGTPKTRRKILKKGKKSKKPKIQTKSAKIRENSKARRKMKTSQSRRALKTRLGAKKGKLTLKGKIKKLLMKKNLKLRRMHIKTRKPRMNDIRQKVVRVIERSLVEAPKIPLICHLFTERDSMGTPKAPLKQVLRTLKISDFVKRTHLLKDNYMKSLSKFTTLFAVEQDDEPYGPLFVKYWPIYDKEEATVYVDNLPEACCEQQLMRLAACYGTIAELSVARKGARWVRPRFHPRKRQKGHPPQRRYHKYPPKKKPLINVGNRPKPFGFIRFVDKDSAEKMIRDFIVNDPSINYERMEARRKLEEAASEEMIDDGVPEILAPGEIENLVPVVPRELPRTTRFVELYMTKLFREIRHLKQRRKRRTWPMANRLYKLQRRLDELFRREYRCLRRAGIIDPRGRVSRRDRHLIHRVLPPCTGITRHYNGRAPPPSTPRNGDEPSTSDAQPEPSPPFPYVINKIKKVPKKKKIKKKKLTLAEKKAKEEAKYFRKQRKRKPKGTVYIKKWVDGKVIRKRRRRRKKQSRKLPKYIPGGQVRRFFQDIQVLSLMKYKSLKEEYQELIRLEKERVKDPPTEMFPPMEEFPMVVEDPGVENDLEEQDEEQPVMDF